MHCAAKPSPYPLTSDRGEDDDKSMKSDLVTCFKLIKSQLAKHELSFHQVTVFRVCLPAHGFGLALNHKGTLFTLYQIKALLEE